MISLLTHLRIDIGDFPADSGRFTDFQLYQILGKATRRINRELSLTGTSDELTMDASGNLIQDDNDAADLILLQSECMILQIDQNHQFNGQAIGTSNGQGVFVRDGEQSLDTRGESANLASSRTSYLNGNNNPCVELQRALAHEKLVRFDAQVDIW